MDARLVALLVLCVAFAGCSEPTEQTTDDPIEPVNNDGSIGNDVNATPQDGSYVSAAQADSFLMTATSGPDIPMTSFHWRVPNGSFIEEEGFFGDWEMLPLVILPVANAEISRWGIEIFHTEGSIAIPMGSITEQTIHGMSKLAVLETPSTYTPDVEGMYATLYAGNFQEGDRLTFVVYAESATKAPFEIAFRVLDEVPDWNEDPPTEVKEVLTGDVAQLLSYGTGAGVRNALYFDFTYDMLTEFTEWTDDITVEDRIPTTARPVVGVRDVTLSAGMEGDGFMSGVGIYWIGEGAAKWEANIDSHGTKMDARSVTAGAPVPFFGLVPSLLFGMPFFVAQTEGTGGSQTDFTIQTANQQGFEITLMYQTNLGASLTTLTGLPGESLGYTFTGLVGDVPPGEWTMDLRGDDLVLHGDRTIIYRGLMDHY